MVNEYGRTPEQIEQSSPYNTYTPPGHAPGASPSPWEMQNQQVSPASGNDQVSQQIAAGQWAKTVEQQQQYQRVQEWKQQQAILQQQQKQMVAQQQASYVERAKADAAKRAGYYSTLGDRETKRRTAAGENPGSVLEAQRQVAYKTPTLIDDRFFTNELGKYNHNAIEESSAYHSLGMREGTPIPANPLENRGDVALAFEKAGNPKDFGKNYAFNPNVNTMINLLPGGTGLQERSWTEARTGKQERVDYMPAVNFLNAQQGRQGVYGGLYGGIPDIATEASGRLVGGNQVAASTQMLGSTTNKIMNPISIGNGLFFTSISPASKDTVSVIPPSGKIELDLPFLGRVESPVIPGLAQFQQPTFVYSKPEDSPTVIGMMGGNNPKYKLATSIEGLGAAPWVAAKGATYSGGSQLLSDLTTQLPVENQQLESLARGNVQGKEWKGSEADYNKYTDLSSKYNAKVDVYNAEAAAHPIYKTSYDLTKQTMMTPYAMRQGMSKWDMEQERFGNAALSVINTKFNGGLPMSGQEFEKKAVGFIDAGFMGVERSSEGRGRVAEVSKLGGGAYEWVVHHPGDVVILAGESYLGGAILGEAIQTGRVGIAAAAQSGRPTLSYIGRAASTPVAGDVFTLAKWGIGGAVVAGSGMNIINQPTRELQGQEIMKTGVMFAGFGVGLSGVPEVKVNNPYIGKSMSGEPAYSPLEKLTFKASTTARSIFSSDPAAYREIATITPKPRLVEPPIKEEPNFRILTHSGKYADEIKATLIEQPHSVYGSASSLQQYPKNIQDAAGLRIGKDVDTYIESPKTAWGSLSQRTGLTEKGAQGILDAHVIPKGFMGLEPSTEVDITTDVPSLSNRVFGNPYEPMRFPRAMSEEIKPGVTEGYSGKIEHMGAQVQFGRKAGAVAEFIEDPIATGYRGEKDIYDFITGYRAQKMVDISNGAPVAKYAAQDAAMNSFMNREFTYGTEKGQKLWENKPTKTNTVNDIYQKMWKEAAQGRANVRSGKGIDGEIEIGFESRTPEKGYISQLSRSMLGARSMISQNPASSILSSNSMTTLFSSGIRSDTSKSSSRSPSGYKVSSELSPSNTVSPTPSAYSIFSKSPVPSSPSPSMPSLSGYSYPSNKPSYWNSYAPSYKPSYFPSYKPSYQPSYSPSYSPSPSSSTVPVLPLIPFFTGGSSSGMFGGLKGKKPWREMIPLRSVLMTKGKSQIKMPAFAALPVSAPPAKRFYRAVGRGAIVAVESAALPRRVATTKRKAAPRRRSMWW